MNRELKFRAWDKVNNEFADLNGLAVNLQTGELCCDWVDSLYVNEQSRNSEDFILMQFTGLLDKNGKEIYEGDILQYQNASVAWHKSPTYHLMKWINRDARWSDYGPKDQFVIVGNVYENPELINASSLAAKGS